MPPANEKNEDLGPIEKKLLGELSSKAQLKKEKLLEKSEQNLHSQNIIRPTTDHNPLIFQSKALDLSINQSEKKSKLQLNSQYQEQSTNLSTLKNWTSKTQKNFTAQGNSHPKQSTPRKTDIN